MLSWWTLPLLALRPPRTLLPLYPQYGQALSGLRKSGIGPSARVEAAAATVKTRARKALRFIASTLHIQYSKAFSLKTGPFCGDRMTDLTGELYENGVRRNQER